MKYSDIKIGDIVTINKKPKMWNSHFVNRNPLCIEYPFTGKVINMHKSRDYDSANIGGYGFDLKSINSYSVRKNNYEIF